MDNHAWPMLGTLLLGAFLGAVGQLIRVVVGIKKENDQANAANQTLKQRFSAQELWTSLGIAIVVGAVAGVVSALTIQDLRNQKALMALIGVGYSGTDFIEGFMKRALPGQ